MKNGSSRIAMSWTIDYNRLATYNSEVHRGLIHTDKYKLEMEKIQEEFNKELKEHYEK